jgi:hypothetical protein
LDVIPGEFWKLFWREGKNVYLLTRLLDTVTHEDIIPSEWKIAITRRIHNMKGREYDTNNRRGTALLLVMGKIFWNFG